jgi:hypothetical protein
MVYLDDVQKFLVFGGMDSTFNGETWELALTEPVAMYQDTTLPDVSNPSDISYTEGSTANFIIWTVGDQNPGVYNVTKDGTLYVSDTSWSNGTISISVDGLAVGTYTFVITVYDTSGNSNTDTVIVGVSPVVDSTPPDLDSPADVSYTEGSTANFIIWTVGDQNPGGYSVTKDGTLYVSDTSWSNGTISINVDGLAVGTYTFIITVYDASGNSNTDTVTVSVSGSTGTTTTSSTTTSSSVPTTTTTTTSQSTTPIFTGTPGFSSMTVISVIILIGVLLHRRKNLFGNRRKRKSK